MSAILNFQTSTPIKSSQEEDHRRLEDVLSHPGPYPMILQPHNGGKEPLRVYVSCAVIIIFFYESYKSKSFK